MERLDFNKLSIIVPEELTDQEKDELYLRLINFEYGSDISHEYLTLLLGISQEILKFKGEQVESLVNEIDKLATRQGEEEAERYQSLIDQIELLQLQVFEAQKRDSLSGKAEDTLRKELVDVELKYDHLAKEVKAKEQDLLNEREEVKKLTNQVIALQNEKEELCSQLSMLESEHILQKDTKLQSDNSTMLSTKHRDVIHTIQHKNKHISQLLLDIETLEKENNSLKLNIAHLQYELEEKSVLTISVIAENADIKEASEKLKESMVVLEEQNFAFKNQLLEMADIKEQRDEQLDQLGIALDARLSQWQDLLLAKDAQLIELKKKLTQMSAQFPNFYVDSTRHHLANMNQSLESKEREIEELHQQLQNAQVAIAERDSIIDQLRNNLKLRSDKQRDSPRMKNIKQELLEAQSRLKFLDTKLKDAENDAERNAKEATDLVIKLREYETGVFGLPEAIEEIKELKKQKEVRDKHIEQLIVAGNQLQSKANIAEEENLALREKLGLDIDYVIRSDRVLPKSENDQVKLDEISHQLDVSNNIQLTLKVQNNIFQRTIAKLKDQLRNLGVQPNIVSHDDDSISAVVNFEVNGVETKEIIPGEAKDLENKLQDVIDENEALRKGMHEILDCVRSHDASSKIQIESACLERLLEALDSRHVSGWYHPAMRLQAQLNLVEGNNAALREQLRITRYNEHESSANLLQALSQIELLQSELQRLTTFKPLEKKSKTLDDLTQHDVTPSKALLFNESLSFDQGISHKNSYEEKEINLKLEEEIKHLNKKLSESERDLSEINKNYESDKEIWQTVKKELQIDIDSLNEKVCMLSDEVKEYASTMEAFEKGPDELKRIISKSSMRLATLSCENEKLKRKCNVIQQWESQSTADKKVIQECLNALQTSTTKKIKDLSRDKAKVEQELIILQKLHSECFDACELEETKQQLNHLTLKYRELLATKTNMLPADSKVRLSNPAENINLKMDAKDYPEKMYNLLKDQLKVSEDHCKELETQLGTMVQQNLKSQLIEADLRNQLVNSVPNSQMQDAKKQIAYYENVVVELKYENDKIKEGVSSFNENDKAFAEFYRSSSYQHDSLQRQILELTAASEDKVTIERLTRELFRAQHSEMNSSKLIEDLQKQVETFQCTCSDLQTKLNNLHVEHISEKSEINKKYRWLIRIVDDLHQRFLGHLSILSADTYQSMLSQANLEKANALAMVAESLNVENQMKIFLDKNIHMEGSSVQKLQELKLKIHCQSLASQLTHSEEQLKRLEKLCTIFHDELLKQEKIWEKKQLVWEQTLLKIECHSNKLDVLNENICIKLDEVSHNENNYNSTEKTDKWTMTSFTFTPDSYEGLLVMETENMKTLSNHLNQETSVMNAQSKKLHNYEMEITELRAKIESLKRQLAEKEKKLKLNEQQLLDVQALWDNKNNIEYESTEILALKATIASLQNIVNQKEETISRYQSLLSDTRDDHSKTIASLQEELASLHQTLDKQDNTYVTENKVNIDTSSAMKVILERYLARVHQLEDDLTQNRDRGSRLAMDLSASQQQAEKWTHTAEERLKTIQEMKQRLDNKRSKDDLIYTNSDIMEKSTEIEELNKIIYNLKDQLASKGTASAVKERLKAELEQTKKRLDVVLIQNTEFKAEIDRIRKQLTLRHTNSRKTEIVSTPREEALQKKVKLLEDQLSEYKTMVQRNEELHKLKCDEEFGKWEEKKRWQATNEKLKLQLKEKNNEVDAMKCNLDRLKCTILRLEKEKITLEGKLKMSKVSTVSHSLVDELERDRIKLQEELKSVRHYKLMKSPTSINSSSIKEAEDQKNFSTQVTQKYGDKDPEDFEKLIEMKNRLQQQNLKLEAHNLELNIELEKYRLAVLTPREYQGSNSESEKFGNTPKERVMLGKNRSDLERAIVVLKRVMEKLQAENKQLLAERSNELHSKDYIETLQIELQRCQENYLDAVDKCSALEEELKICKERISFNTSNSLAEELTSTKAQLAQKCYLLSKVKVLLENAAIRERALNEQVQELEKLVYPQRGM